MCANLACSCIVASVDISTGCLSGPGFSGPADQTAVNDIDPSPLHWLQLSSVLISKLATDSRAVLQPSEEAAWVGQPRSIDAGVPSVGNIQRFGRWLTIWLQSFKQHFAPTAFWERTAL